MKEQIVEKLKHVLSKPIDSESQVVYVMAELRKILEHMNLKNKRPYLNLYCSWVLHVKIDSSSTAKRILEELEGDEIIDDIAFIRLIGANQLRSDILTLIREDKLDIPRDNFEVDSNWRNFRRLLQRVILNCPLEKEANLDRDPLPKYIISEFKITEINKEEIKVDVKYNEVKKQKIYHCSINADFDIPLDLSELNEKTA